MVEVLRDSNEIVTAFKSREGPQISRCGNHEMRETRWDERRDEERDESRE
jgi:hypothetical protein